MPQIFAVSGETWRGTDTARGIQIFVITRQEGQAFFCSSDTSKQCVLIFLEKKYVWAHRTHALTAPPASRPIYYYSGVDVRLTTNPPPCSMDVFCMCVSVCACEWVSEYVRVCMYVYIALTIYRWRKKKWVAFTVNMRALSWRSEREQIQILHMHYIQFVKIASTHNTIHKLNLIDLTPELDYCSQANKQAHTHNTQTHK